ncbi:MAG: SDR family oxidoreductase [Bacteroidales bacterium]|jgi:short-subunit dehydrogenase|nr:SDR family oxidoreductase [Bacteroidales bacterium]
MNIVVTGAGKGIGLELCKKFLQQESNKVIAISRNIENLKELQEKYINLCPVSFDLTNEVYTPIIEKLSFFEEKKTDILINNAGLLIKKPFDKLSRADNNKMFAVNFHAPFQMIQTLLPFISDNAHIVNISSMGGFQGSEKFQGLTGYSASKAALAILTECLAAELKEKKISINCLCLGSVKTEMLQKAFPGYNAAVNATQMADFIADFACKAHRHMNGKIIPVSLSTP